MYDDKSYLVGGFDLLKIKDTNWNYSQNSCIIGINHSFDENYLKFNFAYQAGKFTSNLDSSYNYKDNLRIYDLELIHRFFPYYIGIGGDWQLLTGIKNTEAYHLKFRIERYLNPKLFISLKSLYSNISDNRKLFSEQIYSSYLLIPELLLKASLMIGKRAYYFDSDLLIFFNQDDTQNYLYSIQAEYTLWNTLSLVASYQKTGFTKSDSTSYKYSINYLIAGLKLKIDF